MNQSFSYYGVTFLLPRYYGDISGGEENFVYILSALVGATFIPGKAFLQQKEDPPPPSWREPPLPLSIFCNRISLLFFPCEGHAPVGCAPP